MLIQKLENKQIKNSMFKFDIEHLTVMLEIEGGHLGYYSRRKYQIWSDRVVVLMIESLKKWRLRHFRLIYS